MLSIPVVGSTGNEYTVSVTNANEYYCVSCNCKAGSMNKLCKHKINMLADIDKEKILLEGIDLASFLSSDLMIAYRLYQESNTDLMMAKKQFDSAKKKLEKVIKS